MGDSDDPGLQVVRGGKDHHGGDFAAAPPPVPHTIGPGFPDNNSIHMRHIGDDIVAFFQSNPTPPGPNSVNTAAIQDKAVTTAKIADKAITKTQIGDGAVTSQQLGQLSVLAVNLGNNVVDNTKVVNGFALVAPQTKPADITAAPTQQDFNNLLALLKTAGVFK